MMGLIFIINTLSVPTFQQQTAVAFAKLMAGFKRKIEMLTYIDAGVKLKREQEKKLAVKKRRLEQVVANGRRKKRKKLSRKLLVWRHSTILPHILDLPARYVAFCKIGEFYTN